MNARRTLLRPETVAGLCSLVQRKWQEAVSAFVVAADEAVPEQELLEFAAARLARHGLPKREAYALVLRLRGR